MSQHISGSGGDGIHLRIDGLSKAFASTQALDDVGLEVAKGELHALLGTNGSGKSTLIKILAGVLTGDCGVLHINGVAQDLAAAQPAQMRRVGLRFVHQQPSVFPDLTVAENLVIGAQRGSPLAPVRRRALRENAASALARFRIDAEPSTLLGDLRPAAQTMVAIARALQDDETADARVLVLDEPTANLEPAEVTVLFDALRGYSAAGQTIVMVTHRLDQVIELADTATILRDGRNAGSLARADFTQERLSELIVGRPLESYFPSHAPAREDEAVLVVSDLHGGKLDGANLSVHEGEIVGLAGLVDSGHTDLLKILFGVTAPSAGEIVLRGKKIRPGSPFAAMKAGIAYVPGDRTADGIFPELTVRENLSAASTGRYGRAWGFDRGRESADAERDIERFGIRTSSPDALISDLSGGNQQKVVMARWLRRNPQVLLLDDPTQGVDVGARADLWSVVDVAVEEGLAVLVTSSDPEELMHICDRVVILQSGKVAHELHTGSASADNLLELLHLTPEERV